MNEQQLNQMKAKKGFIAALDQSGGSTPKALKLYGVDKEAYHNDEEMYMVVHAMRTRIVKSPAFTGDKIIGAILFENTMDRKIDDLYTADYLWEKKEIIPFLKVDQGLQTKQDGVQLMREIIGLDALLQRAVKRNIFGTKMRSVIQEANPKGIKQVVEQQFELARKIISYGLVPIIEPEVDIMSKDKAECEELLKKEIKENLLQLADDEKVILKVSIPTKEDFYSDLMEDEHVVRVVALSGGYSREEANQKLAQNQGLIASFSRALSEGLNINQTEKAFDKMLADSIDQIYVASVEKKIKSGV